MTELIVHEGNGMRRALLLTGPTLYTFLGIDYFGLLPHPLIDFAGTDIYAIAAARTRFLVDLGMHAFLLLKHLTKDETIVSRVPRYRSTSGLH
jgi:hypothetical protein